MKANNRMPKLHVGPMSINVINACIATADELNDPICLICSRRQIDARINGGGYVGNLDTEEYGRTVSAPVKRGAVTLARDHGGPYQRSEEKTFPVDRALNSFEATLKADLNSGFEIIHLDPEKWVNEADQTPVQSFTAHTKDLISLTRKTAEKIDKGPPKLEIGTDEGVAMSFSKLDWEYFLYEVFDFCSKSGAEYPTTFALPLGTKVKEYTNVGPLITDPNNEEHLQWISEARSLATKFNLKLKLHNADYLKKEELKLYSSLGVDEFNIAPELGTLETKEILAFLKSENNILYDNFIDLAVQSRMWEKWLIPNSSASLLDKGIIAGHYIFATPQFISLIGNTDSILLNKLITEKIKKFLRETIFLLTD